MEPLKTPAPTPVNALPEWLTAGIIRPPSTSPEAKALQITQFEMVLPRVLEEVCSGASLDKALAELPVTVNAGAFIRWLRKQAKYYELYKEAKEVRTEVWAGRIIDHAEASDTIEDVSRSKLIIDAYKWLMGADNRKVYGDTKTIEMNGTISVRAALDEARARVTQIIDVFPVEDEPPLLLREVND